MSGKEALLTLLAQGKIKPWEYKRATRKPRKTKQAKEVRS